ncbi:MAG: hypothetical protein HYV26_20215 [Candidatus Hydrogenedentes bacterium]|nr:hypothetical protein [Candidatus Hydrogenedentota bacterium]MBI3118565.1 hypothetical protein [Candidatus Hydrogenedentota bacterium]
MKHTSWILTLAVGLSLLIPVRGAFGWGERAQQTISMMATQVLKEQYKEVFRPGDSNFEKDVMRGAISGSKVLAEFLPLNSDAETMQAVSAEIQLLHDVQQYGTTSYFAFRMGVLSALVADIIVPYGFSWREDDVSIQARVNADIDKRLGDYAFRPSNNRRTLIRDTAEYFRTHRSFHESDKQLILDDYLRGPGYNGFLKKGGPAYFERAVGAVADAWHTVLSPESGKIVGTASKRQLTWYFVKEVEYLLNVKNNYHQAIKAYEHLTTINSDITAAFESAGDLFYNFGKARGNLEAVDRGVREWQKAYDMGGPERSRLSTKLSDHYLTEGQFLLVRAASDEAEDNDLPNALDAFEEALQYNRTSQQAADLIEKTHIAIADRRERLQLAVQLIANAESVRESADSARVQGDYNSALTKYQQAITVYEAVDDEFKDQAAAAENGARESTRGITNVIDDVFDKASEAIEQGDRLQETNKYEEAISSYERVDSIVNVIPADAKASHLQQKDETLRLAANKIDEAKNAKIRYDAAQAQQQQQKK